MSKIDILEKRRLILEKLFLLSNRFQTIGDQIFTGEMTLRQWLLTVAVVQCTDISPSLGSVAETMGTSHQNVKQLALRLEKGGFLSLVKDENDKRVTHLILTEKSFTYWKRQQDKIRQYLNELFKDLSEEEVEALYYCINKLYDSVLKMKRVL
jgi:DNA-binding MarR family transcriptional regulator